MNIIFSNILKSLFSDPDEVINQKPLDNYMTSWSELNFEDGVRCFKIPQVFINNS